MYEYDDRIVACTMNYFDRFLAKSPEALGDTRKKRLLIMTCLSTSIKVHGCPQENPEDPKEPPKKKGLGLRQFMSADRSTCTSIEEMVELEKELFSKLDWLLHPPICADYIQPICTLLQDYLSPRAVDYIYYDAMKIMGYLTRSGTLEFRDAPPSSLAVAILMYCLQGRHCRIDLLYELYRHGIYVDGYESHRCFHELFRSFEAPEVPGNPIERPIERKGTQDNRMGSPIGVAASRLRNSWFV